MGNKNKISFLDNVFHCPKNGQSVLRLGKSNKSVIFDKRYQRMKYSMLFKISVLILNDFNHPEDCHFIKKMHVPTTKRLVC